ncbi:MAG: hypothetical protein MJA27_09565, partial [Pseudanabaenales cyanobacterium]|nr:hypothetical protein [Pseudanabaenales cyanobacterium]
MSRSILKQLIAKRSMHRFHAGANGKPLPSKFLAQLAAGLGLTGVIALGGTSPVFAQTMIEDVPAGGITFGSTTNLCNNFLVRSFNVNDNISVGDVSLGLNISHGFRGAIRGFLQAPSSNFIEFLNINGGDTNDNYDVLFQDGGGAINDGGIDDVGSPFYDRTVNPNQALSTFAGESAFGTWNLFLCDGGSGIQGTYNRSLLTIFPPDISGFAFDDVNRDNTRGASEGVLSNVGLTAYRDDGDGAFEPGADDALVATSQTGSTGAYAFNGLTNGDYWIDVDETDSDLAGRSYGGSAATGTADPRLVPFSGAAIGDIDFPFFQDLQFLCDPGDPTGQLAFLDGAVLESGSDLQVGAVYRFADVFANTDALVEVAAFNGGATLAAIDNDSTGVSSAFQPTLNAASGTTSSVDFNITFVVKDTNTPVTITFKAAGVDIDGDGGSLREFIELTNLSSFSLATPTTLTATAITSGNRFESNTVVAQPGVSATATQTLATTQYTSVSQFRYRIGAIDGGASSATQRLNSLYFGCTNGPVTSANLEDYGDAPDTYGTDATAGNSGGDPVGASHTIVSGIHLGSTAPDDETDASTPLDGSGDGAEDDGINLPTLTEGDTSYTIPAGNITATGTGVLHAWLDFDQSGTFESGEYSSVSVTSGTLAGDLTWNSITAGGAGDTYARFRFTSDASINANTPGGAA